MGMEWTHSGMQVIPISCERPLSILLNFFSPLTNLFLTFVVFACFATTRDNMRFRAKKTRDSAQGYNQCISLHIGDPVMRTDIQTGGDVSIMSLPKFLGLIGYQISLVMVLCWCTSARAPLLRSFTVFSFTARRIKVIWVKKDISKEPGQLKCAVG